jgi:hypothetical protein
MTRPPDTAVEHSLLQEFTDGVETLKRQIGYNPTYFIGMVAEHGPADASRRLIRSKDASDGFTRLWEAGRLDMTVEAIALLPWYAELFDEHDTVLARRRLDAYGFDVDDFLIRRTQSPPSWWDAGSPS